jgi:hypothetical protein
MALTARERQILRTRILHLRVQVDEVSRRLTDVEQMLSVDGAGTAGMGRGRCQSPSASPAED